MDRWIRAERSTGRGLTDEQYGYALRSHFDWVVTDLASTVPEFAVEFDGQSQEDDRDALKDSICERLGLPLLRIDRFGLRPTIRRTVIWYLVESWALWCGFSEAQDDGTLPLDEVFEPWAFIDGVDAHGYPIFRDMARPTRTLVARLAAKGLLRDPIASHAYRSGHRDDPDHAEAYAWAMTKDSRVIIGHARIRAYSFPAVLDSDLSDDLAHLDLGARLMRLTEGDGSVAQDGSTLPTFGLDWSGGGMVHGPIDLPAA